MATLYIAKPNQSLADLAAEFVAKEWDRDYANNFSVCQALADEKGAGPSRVPKAERERREYARLFGAEE